MPAPKPAEKQPQASHPAQASLDALAKAQMAGLPGASAPVTAMIEAWADMTAEYFTFLAERIRQDVRSQHALLHCKDPLEYQHLQAEFMQTALNEYHDAFARLAGIGTGWARSAGVPTD